MPDMSVWGERVWGLLELGGAEYLDVVIRHESEK